MKKVSNTLILGIFLGTLAAGCAKPDMVKKDSAIEPPTPAAMTKTPQTVLPESKPQPVKQSAESESKTAAVKQAQTGDSDESSLQKIFFDFDSYTLSENSRSVLASNARIVLKKGVKVQVEGHCDERGSDEYNLALGEKRASAAASYLITMGVPRDRLSVISYGREKPAVPESNERAWAQNRRDEFILLSK